MKFDSYITSGTKTASTVKDYTEFLNKYEFDKEKFSLKKSAFTLAETLITLTIIGVIAALTIKGVLQGIMIAQGGIMKDTIIAMGTGLKLL